MLLPRSLLLRLVSLTICSQAYGHASRGSGSHTPRTLNSLSAIAGQEGEEEEWETEIRGLRNDEEVFYSTPTRFTAHNLARQHMLARIRSTSP